MLQAIMLHDVAPTCCIRLARALQMVVTGFLFAYLGALCVRFESAVLTRSHGDHVVLVRPRSIG